MKRTVFATAILTAAGSLGAQAGTKDIAFTQLWTYAHGVTTTRQVAEIPAFDAKTNTIWVAGVVGVDVLDADDGALVDHIDVTPFGFVNSVAIHRGVAALAVEAAPDRTEAGHVLFYKTRRIDDGVIDVVEVGALPDMLTFTHDGKKLLVANEATPNAVADTAYQQPDPVGSVTIIEMESRTVVATLDFAGVPTSGANLRTDFTPTGSTSFDMDFEPEYIAVDDDDERAFVTLQEANAIAVLDLEELEFRRVIGLGAKDFNVAGNEIDPIDNDATVVFQSVAAKGLYMPDTIATYQWRGDTYVVMANEGDFREDNVDRGATSAAAPLNRLRVATPPSASPAFFAAGARSFSIRDTRGRLVFDSGSRLDREAFERGIYDDGRSRDKGV
ncbi:MAG TPA: choice-of-anchor I family protein, partial [Pseudomonadales bacterium]